MNPSTSMSWEDECRAADWRVAASSQGRAQPVSGEGAECADQSDSEVTTGIAIWDRSRDFPERAFSRLAEKPAAAAIQPRAKLGVPFWSAVAPITANLFA